MNLCRWSLLCTLALFSACAPTSPLACPDAAVGRSARVFFATDRKQANVPAKAAPRGGVAHFTGDRTDPPALQMGWQQIALGPRHRLGLLDTAVAVSPAEVQSSARGGGGGGPHPLATDAEIRAYVRTTLRAIVRSAPAPALSRRQVLLFVHGYNTDFDYSVRKTAQLAGDLRLVDCAGTTRGLAVAYSWPSQASLLGYLADEENAEWTQQRLVLFLEALSEVAREEGAEFQIVAHSMGCRLVIRSLAQIALMRGRSANAGKLAHNVVLLAPDVSRPLFDQYFARFVPLIGHLTIYVSAKDHALAISGILHRSHQRLGFIGSTIQAALSLPGQITGSLTGQLQSLTGTESEHRSLGASVERAAGTGKIDMVDVTKGIADPLGHSYEDPAFIRDLHELIYRGTPAGKRANLVPQQVRSELFGLHGESLHYFQLKPR